MSYQEDAQAEMWDAATPKDDPAPTAKIDNMRVHRGVAGQFSVSADVTYPDEPTSRIEFVGSVYGGPVVMRTAGALETFVTNPERFGKFSKDWVTKFLQGTA